MRIGTVNIFSFVLEDDIDDLQLIEESLKKHGIKNYKLFQNTEDLFNNLTSDIHIVLLDHFLSGGLTGIDVCKKIREVSKDSFIIIISAQQSKDVVIEYLNACADKYIDKSKPGYMHQLREYLDAGLDHAVERLREIETLIKMRKEINERREKFEK